MMFSLPTKLIIAGVLFMIISAALYGAKRSYDNGIRESERAKYSALINKCAESKRTPAECAKEWTDAVAFNVALQVDLEKLRKASQSCSTETQKGGDLTAKAQAEKDRRLSMAQGRLAASASRNNDLEIQLIKATGRGRTCEQTMTSVGDALRTVALQRIKFALGFDDSPPDDGSVKVK